MKTATPIKILLVEDNPVDAMLLREYLAGDMFTVIPVERLDKALTRLSSESFDVVLVDLTLPDSDRIQTVPRLHALAPQAPIVVLTGADDEDMGLEAVRVGAQDYLVKGQAGTKAIVRAIRYAMERKRAETELRQSRDLLELRVRQRTAELERSVAMLGKEISDRTISESALGENEFRFHAMIDAIPGVFWLSAPDLSTTYFVSRSYADVWGRSCESLRARPQSWMEAVDAEDRQRVEQGFRQWLGPAANTKADPLEMEFGVVRPDGSTVTVAARIVAVYDLGRQLQFIFCMAQDRPRRRGGREAQVAVSPDERIRGKDKGVANLFSYSPRQAVGLPARMSVGRWARLRSWLRPQRHRSAAGYRAGPGRPANAHQH